MCLNTRVLVGALGVAISAACSLIVEPGVTFGDGTTDAGTPGMGGSAGAPPLLEGDGDVTGPPVQRRFDDPVIFFTDITSGPNTGGNGNQGAFISLYGENFEDDALVFFRQGTLEGPVGSIELVKEDHAARDLNLAVVQLGENVPTGDIELFVRRPSDGRESNAVPFTVRPGNLYFVDPDDGDDTDNGSIETPLASLAALTARLEPGDIAYLRDGAHVGDRTGCNPQLDPSTRCGLLLAESMAQGGTRELPIGIIGYPGEYVDISVSALDPSATEESAIWIRGLSHFVIANIRMRDLDFGIRLENAENVRVVGNTFENLTEEGTFWDGGTAGLSVLGNRVVTADGLTYGSLPTESLRVAFNKVSSVRVALSVALFNGGQSQYDHNLVIGGTTGIGVQSCAPDCPSARAIVHANVISGASIGVMTDGFGSADSELFVFNNTIVDAGFEVFKWDQKTLPGPDDDLHFFNNIFLPNSEGDHLCIVAPDNGILCDRTEPASFDSHHNLWRTSTDPQWDPDAVLGNPEFVDVTTDYRIAESSAAYNAGAPMPPELSDVEPMDYRGVPQPQDGDMDIGAFERVPTDGVLTTSP